MFVTISILAVALTAWILLQALIWKLSEAMIAVEKLALNCKYLKENSP